MAASGSQDAAHFYDGFAGDYELVYGGQWERAVDEQAGALDRLIHTYVPHAGSVLDCACGIGTVTALLTGPVTRHDVSGPRRRSTSPTFATSAASTASLMS